MNLVKKKVNSIIACPVPKRGEGREAVSMGSWGVVFRNAPTKRMLNEGITYKTLHSKQSQDQHFFIYMFT